MSRIRMPFEIAPSSGVMPRVKPTVPMAEAHSKRASSIVTGSSWISAMLATKNKVP